MKSLWPHNTIVHEPVLTLEPLGGLLGLRTKDSVSGETEGALPRSYIFPSISFAKNPWSTRARISRTSEGNAGELCRPSFNWLAVPGLPRNRKVNAELSSTSTGSVSVTPAYVHSQSLSAAVRDGFMVRATWRVCRSTTGTPSTPTIVKLLLLRARPVAAGPIQTTYGTGKPAKSISEHRMKLIQTSHSVLTFWESPDEPFALTDVTTVSTDLVRIREMVCQVMLASLALQCLHYCPPVSSNKVGATRFQRQTWSTRTRTRHRRDEPERR